ncbi:hypothetical protein GJ496_006125 [Pomphorhynchus laevis]|nr:hypothetical protein GJ496_006125 [Pomphorhynchus laevis]
MVMPRDLRLESLLKASSARVEIADRRMRQVYSLIEHGNVKKALQEIDKLLKKISPQPLVLLSLRCLAAHRANRVVDAHRQMIDILQRTDLVEDEHTVSVLSYYLQESNQTCRLIQLHRMMCAHQLDERALIQLFFAQLLHGGQHEQQRHTVNQLYHLTKNNRYKQWTVVCLLNQILYTDTESREYTILIKLANRIIESMDDNIYFQISMADITKDYKSILTKLNNVLCLPDCIEDDQKQIIQSLLSKSDTTYLHGRRIKALIHVIMEEDQLFYLIREEFTFLTANWSYFKELLDKTISVIMSLDPFKAVDLIDWLEPLRIPLDDRCQTYFWVRPYSNIEILDLLGDMVEATCITGHSPVYAQNSKARVSLVLLKDGKSDRQIFHYSPRSACPISPSQSDEVYQSDVASLAAIHVCSRTNSGQLLHEIKRYLLHYGKFKCCRFDIMSALTYCDFTIRRLIARDIISDCMGSLDWPKVFYDYKIETLVVNMLTIVNYLNAHYIDGQLGYSLSSKLSALKIGDDSSFTDKQLPLEVRNSMITYLYLSDIDANNSASALSFKECKDLKRTVKPGTQDISFYAFFNDDTTDQTFYKSFKENVYEEVDYFSCDLDKMFPPKYYDLLKDPSALLRFMSAFAIRYLESYRSCRALDNFDNKHNEKLPSGDLSFPDALQILCVSGVRSCDVFFDCVCMLEDQLARRPSHLYANLLLLRLYSVCGAYDCLEEHFQRLNVKNIQAHSLSHLIVNEGCRLGCWTQSIPILEYLSRSMIANRDESAHILIDILKSDKMPYKQVMITSLTTTLDRFNRNIEYVSAFINYLTCWLIVHDEMVEVDIPDTTNLVDTRDFYPLKAFCSMDHLLNEQRSRSLIEMEGLLSLRKSVLINIQCRSKENITPIDRPCLSDKWNKQRFCIHGPCSTGLDTVIMLGLDCLVEKHCLLEMGNQLSFDNCLATVIDLTCALEKYLSLIDDNSPTGMGLSIEVLALTFEFCVYSLIFIRNKVKSLSSNNQNTNNKSGNCPVSLKNAWLKLLNYMKDQCRCFNSKNGRRFVRPSSPTGKIYQFRRSADMIFNRINEAHNSIFTSLSAMISKRIIMLDAL